MTLETRVQLIAVFAIASMGVVASVVALVYRVKLLGRSDPNWQQAAVYIANVVENNVAIIDGSTPAGATFVRVYVSESALINTLRSKIRRVSGSSSGGHSGPPYPGPGSDLATFGSPNAAHVQGPGGHELTDPTVTAAKIGSDDHYLSYRNYAAGYQQPHAQPSSTERLV